ncbi:MAG: hypothetical protein IPP78_11755 [Holophagaceae bacterium]|nr:hypothetical protein [Holophagaceae bacterium]
MKNKGIVLAFSVLILTSCMVASRPGGGVEIVPILPTIVELDLDAREPYYEHNGYHYYYTNERWYYSSARDGERRELPRSHWPKETRRRGGDRHDHH